MAQMQSYRVYKNTDIIFILVQILHLFHTSYLMPTYSKQPSGVTPCKQHANDREH